ncbi:MAG: hypothetical protein LC746_07305, partial [Acidobacteria bacterium]|nr:hypothetical protein [Acidobacteriota bacterium]
MKPHARNTFAILLVALLALAFPSRRARTQDTTVRLVAAAPENSTSVNPALSGDGRRLVFESTADLARAGGSPRFRAFAADLSAEPFAVSSLADSRAPAAAVSQDGASVAFASAEDLTGENADRDSEIFLSTAAGLRQLTHTAPADLSTRARDGNFQPSISDDGRLVAFSSNRDLNGANPDANFETFLLNLSTQKLTQLTDTRGIIGATDPKLSGDGSRLAFVRDNAQTSPPSSPTSPASSESQASSSRDLVIYDLAAKTFLTEVAGASNLALTPGRAASDDGTRVVYSAETSANASQVFLYDARNGVTRQLTKLSPRATDVPLDATISGDGSRISFATRRSVVGGNSDASVELYLCDIPTNQLTRVTDAPAQATAEVVSSLNDDGSLVAFSFPRVLAGSVSSEEFANDSEIFLASLPPRAPYSTNLKIRGGATPARDLPAGGSLAAGEIAVALGANLALSASQSQRLPDGPFPRVVKNTSVTVNGRAAQIFYASPAQVNFQIPDQTAGGLAEIVVRNHDGYESRATVQLTHTAPALFTDHANGTGAALALDAATLQPAPFDPHDANGDPRRVILFATGARHAAALSVSIAAHTFPVEQLIPSPDLPGLDELHVALPRSLA